MYFCLVFRLKILLNYWLEKIFGKIIDFINKLFEIYASGWANLISIDRLLLACHKQMSAVPMYQK